MNFILFLGIFLCSLSHCHSLSADLPPVEVSYGVSGLDLYMQKKFFQRTKNGVFVDIGASNGISQNNSYLFEKHLGWTGICIEPVPDYFSELQKNRQCILINGCISNKNGPAKFLRYHLPPFDKSYEPTYCSLLDTFEQLEYPLIFFHVNYRTEITKVQCYLLDHLFETYGIAHVNLLCIDTASMESDFNILKTIDFNRFQIDVIHITNPNLDNTNSKSNPARLLEPKGFYLDKVEGNERIFVNRNFIPQKTPTPPRKKIPAGSML
jgi:FkbM family methyltransferase